MKRIGVVAILPVLSVTVLAATSTGDAGIEPRPSPDELVQRAGSSFAEFRHERTANDEVPHGLATGPLLGDDVADVAHARAVGDNEWIIPAAEMGAVCYARQGRLGCPSLALLEAQGAAPSVSWRGDDYRVDGVAIDSVGSIEVVDSSGKRAIARVSSNRFSVDLDKPPARVSWSGPDGMHTVDYADYLSSVQAIADAAPRAPKARPTDDSH